LAFSDDESLKETDCAYSFTNNIDLRLNKARDTQLFDNNYDMEHYFKYRLSKASLLKDYASATYYQVIFNIVTKPSNQTKNLTHYVIEG